MFNLGVPELLVLALFPLSGILAAAYLAISLRNNARGQRDAR